MALYNGMTAANIKGAFHDVGNELERVMSRIGHLVEIYDTMPGADLTALGVDADWQAQLGSMKTEIAALKAYYDANDVFTKRFVTLTPF